MYHQLHHLGWWGKKHRPALINPASANNPRGAGFGFYILDERRSWSGNRDTVAKFSRILKISIWSWFSHGKLKVFHFQLCLRWYYTSRHEAKKMEMDNSANMRMSPWRSGTRIVIWTLIWLVDYYGFVIDSSLRIFLDDATFAIIHCHGLNSLHKQHRAGSDTIDRNIWEHIDQLKTTGIGPANLGMWHIKNSPQQKYWCEPTMKYRSYYRSYI